ncbi:tRNA uridine-5-carboxymethylaminomethyl(34) synthesis GTPase MnmE [Longirhabdus pacifica]|uniref:tRNA uridine-5-carboxymethylaminomethyl(34) synthesis GTPase MnmE n=1 Tax=Longirhabdus pacifica TaxID=2305227 RepID=UPI0010091B42|nr:tRNA uridine-5-carboxymethylaminomethyl(34) synthesis GTPase MnmE [Longirhabdus pacifica]
MNASTDTITAIATAVGEAGIAVARVSGTEAINIVDKIFLSKKPLTDAPSHSVQYGYIYDPQSGEKIDEVLVTIMRTPRSFTKEDVVEISSHGGFISINAILQMLLDYGARIAEPGEFTKRAFLNGRIDLAQAEAIVDIIRSKSDKAQQLALKQVDGMLSNRIALLRDDLVSLMAHIEVNIDYPEHDVEDLTHAYIRTNCHQSIEGISSLLHAAKQGKVLREGIATAIVGKPNVGKSSLLNILVQESRSIVTDIPGTTRDVIEEYITINGIPIKLLDTAGIRETEDIVEKIGVERSKAALQDADLVLFVVNNHTPLDTDEIKLLQQLKDRQMIIIVNKIDLESKVDLEQLQQLVPREQIIKMSVVEDTGLRKLEERITEMFAKGNIESNDMTYISNVRHIHCLKQAIQSLQDAIESSKASIPIDMIQIDIKQAWESLGEIVGDTVHESLIDQIFSQFCLGK